MKRLADASLGTIGADDLGPFGTGTDGVSALTGISKIVSSVIGVITIAAGIWFLIQFLLGGFGFITSGGDKAKLQTARDKLTNALIGIIVVVASWAIVALAGTFFGVDFLISDPSGLIERLNPR